MPTSERALITPAVLAWARRNAGYTTLHEPAKHMGWDLERMNAVELGEREISLAQARRLAGKYDVPLALFFMPKPPPDEGRPVDRRSGGGALDPGLVRCVRRALRLRSVVLGVAEDLEQEVPAFAPSRPARRTVASFAKSILEYLGGTVRGTLRDRINQVEDLGVTVQQFPSRYMGTTSGFSLYEQPLPVIGINQSDAETRRCFTLMHELAHLVARQSGVCNVHAEVPRDDERFCDRVAAAVLLPARAVRTRARRDLPPLARVRDVARHFSVSDEAAAYRLLELGVVGESQRRDLVAQCRRGPSAPRNRDEQGRDYSILRRAQLGHAASRVLAAGYLGGVLTLTDASRTVGVAPKNFAKFADLALAGGGT